METLLVVMQANSTEQAFGLIEARAIIGIATTALMLIGGIYVVFKYPTRRTGIILGGLLMMLPFTGIILVAFSNVAKESLPLGAWYAVPVAWVAWLILFIFAYATIRRDARPVDRHEIYEEPSEPSAFNAQPSAPAPAKPATGKAGLSADTPVVARCTSCMGRWRTTAGEAKALAACPHCAVSPPTLRFSKG
jgi:hypothetical protein